MRKANKIMMMTVSVLLCLVLFTSTALSGTLAKYSTSGESSTASARVAKWGANIDIWVDSAKLKTVCPDTAFNVQVLEKDKGDNANASIEIKNLKIAPGDDLRDIIKVTFSGNPEVKLRVKFTFKFLYGTGSSTGQYSYDYMRVPAGIGGASANTYIMPVGITFAASKCSEIGKTYSNVISSSYVCEPWRRYTGTGSSNIQKSVIGMNKTEDCVISTMAEKLTGVSVQNTKTTTGSGNTSDPYLYKDFAPSTQDGIMFYDGESNLLDTFELGLEWPQAYTYPSDYNGEKFTVAQMNDVDTWFAKENLIIDGETVATPANRAFYIKCTVSIEQLDK